MAIQITHPFVSLKGDGGDATLVRPSNWNAVHNTSMATGNLIGRQSVGAGSFEEIALSALLAGALGQTSGAAFLAAIGAGGFETGDVKFSINPTAAAGWIAYNGVGTIGNASSGASVLADPTAQALYELIYNNITDAYCPVTGGRSGNSTTDFNAGKKLQLPMFSGRSIIGAGTGASPALTARLNGQIGGTEGETLSQANLPNVNFTVNIPAGQGSHVHVTDRANGTIQSAGTVSGTGNVSASNANTNAATLPAMSGTAASGGSGTTHNNMQPYVALWAKVKL